MSSQQAHRLHVNVIDHMTTWLKQKGKVNRSEARYQIMWIFKYSRKGAESVIGDLVDMRIAKFNDNHLVYALDEEEK